MKHYLILFSLIIGAVVSGMLTWRLSTDALAFLAGVFVGALITMPTILALLWILNSRVERNAHQPGQQPIYPLVVASGIPRPLSLPESFPSSTHRMQASQTPLLPQPFPEPQRTWIMRVYGEE